MLVNPGRRAPRAPRSASRINLEHSCRTRHLSRTSPDSPASKCSSRVLPVGATAFEPRIDPSVLASQLVVLGSTAAAGLYWWRVVVPSERGSLARSKRRGPLNEYLDGLEQDSSRGAERWFYSEWLGKRAKRRSTTPPAAHAASEPEAGSEAVPGEGPANPDILQPSFITPMPSFWSLDNPIVATMAGLSACAALAALVTH